MIDILRHMTEFNVPDFGGRRIDVIGAGATGSRIALSLAKLGIENIHVWDFDKIESHNIPNQAFGNNQVGEFKSEALKKLINSHTDIMINDHNEKVDGSQKLGNIVFLLTDTMASRKEIFEKAIRLKMNTELMIETRMGVDNGRVYTIDPRLPVHIKKWEETLCSDEVAEVSACGGKISVGPTAEIISGLAVWQFMKWHQIQMGKDVRMENEIIFGLRDFITMSREF